ncbi:MAG: sensor histidine kinase [Dehalococcoidia bacterium]
MTAQPAVGDSASAEEAQSAMRWQARLPFRRNVASPRSVRWRLTTLNLALLLLVLAIFSAGQYLLLGRLLASRTAASLRDQAQPAITRTLNGPRGMPDFRSGPTANQLATDLSSADTSGLVVDTTGSVLGRPATGALASTPPTPPPDLGRIARVAADGTSSTYTTTIGGVHLQVALLLLRSRQAGAPVVGVAQVATPLTAVDATRRALLVLDIVGSVLAIMIAAALSPGVAAVALWPLRRMVRTAERLGEGALDQRVRLQYGTDEVGQLADALNQMAARLEALFAAQRQFVSDASHELRTPLTIVRSSIELLLLHIEEDPERVPELLRAAHRELARMSRLVTDLLELARIDAGLRLDLRSLNLIDVAQTVLGDVRALDTGHTFIVEWTASPRVQADGQRVAQILRNFLDNACKFTPSDGAITLRTGGTEADGWVEVADTGPGIAPEQLGLIFDRFYRVDAARSRDRGGAGLGLAIAKSLAEMQHGHLQVESLPGVGACFRLVLPRDAPADHDY